MRTPSTSMRTQISSPILATTVQLPRTTINSTATPMASAMPATPASDRQTSMAMADGFCNSSDGCFGTPNVDGDSDGWCDSSDNCPAVANPSQADFDSDTLGNECDPCLLD